MTTARDGTPIGGKTSRRYQLNMPYETDDALCLGTNCPKAGTCARYARPISRKHYTITPYDKRTKHCQKFVRKEKTTDGTKT